MKRGRPSIAAPLWECHIHLRLRKDEDDDLIAFLSQIPARKRALAVKAALRSGGANGQNSETDAHLSDEALFAALDDFLK